MRISPMLLRWIPLAYPFLRAGSSRSLVCGFCWHHNNKSSHSCFSRITSSYLSRCSPPRHHNSHALFSTFQQQPDILTSTSSNTVKRFKELQQKAKKRRETGETVIEGPRLVLDLLRHPHTRNLVQHIIVSTDLLDDKLQSELQDCLADINSYNDNIQLQTAMPHVLKACSDTVTPQGIVARVKMPQWNPQDIKASTTIRNGDAPLYLVLDGVSDPGNVGTLLRSSVAVGVRAVLLLPGCSDVWNPKAVRSAMTASFLVPTFAFDSWQRAFEQLQEWGCSNLWAATMLEEQGQVISSSHYDVFWGSGPNALIIGSEGKGLSKDIRQCLTTTSSSGGDSEIRQENAVRAVHVPMQGSIESLNAAVCGSVILFEYLRQCRQP